MLNAMIFAAGLGTRLRPLTNSKPKALVELNGKPLLQIAIEKIKELKIKKIVINAHHFSEQIISFTEKHEDKDVELIISDETNQLLNTGGGLMKASQYFDKNADILIYNADVITTAPIDLLIKTHQEQKNLATLMTQKRDASRFLYFDENNQLTGWRNPKTNEEIWTQHSPTAKPMGFNGVHIINSQIFDLIKKEGEFSIIPEYLELAKDYSIKGWSDWEGIWQDVGTPEKLRGIEEMGIV